MSNSSQSPSQAICEQVREVLAVAKSTYHRHCVVLSGEYAWCHNLLGELFIANDLGNTLVISQNRVNASYITQIQLEEALQQLGQEYSHGVMDLHDGIDPNALGAISGTISGGGIMLLLMPPLDKLEFFNDPEKHRMAIWPDRDTEVNNRFLQRLKHILLDSTTIHLIQQNQAIPETTNNISMTHINSSTPLEGYLENELCRTIEQQWVVTAIEHVAHGHRRRPLIVSANRGRGKSSALGIAAAQLMKAGDFHIIVTGPRFNATSVVFEHAQRILSDAQYTKGLLTRENSQLEYYAPDLLCNERPRCNLLLVDEAAAIPAPILERLLDQYARVVFATTTYGYEGTGRGFTIKFQEILNQKTPGWQYQDMELPIRWAPNDPLEEFIFRVLCLDAKVPELDIKTSSNEINIEKINRDNLIKDEATLSSIFGLLVLAHYQTQPRDLRYLLDGTNIDVHVAMYKDQPVGTAIVVQEGELDSEIAEAVFSNERRVHGHLLPQIMESFLGIRDSSRCRYLRIIRIAVHPDCRRLGIGSALLNSIEADAKNKNIDIIGTNFGASRDIMQFWKMNHYNPVQLGLKRNLSHGGNAITYLKPLAGNGFEIMKSASTGFIESFPYLLGECYRDVDYEIVCDIFSALQCNEKLPIKSEHWNDIRIYTETLRGYELCSLSIYTLISSLATTHDMREILEPEDLKLVILKVLQKKSWKDVIAECGLVGKKYATEKLRLSVKKIITAEPVQRSIVVEHKPGI